MMMSRTMMMVIKGTWWMCHCIGVGQSSKTHPLKPFCIRAREKASIIEDLQHQSIYMIIRLPARHLVAALQRL